MRCVCIHAVVLSGPVRERCAGRGGGGEVTPSGGLWDTKMHSLPLLTEHCNAQVGWKYAHEWENSGGAAGGRAVRERNSAVPVQQAKLQVWTVLRVRVKSFFFWTTKKSAWSQYGRRDGHNYD